MTLVVDDARLMRLAAEVPRDSALVLRRATAYRPLVLLLCVLPPIWFAAWSTLDVESAPWALRALAVQNALEIEDWLEPGSQWPECELRSAPPLISWLTAAVLPLLPAGSSLAPVLISCLSMMGATALLWQLCREAVGERTALILTMLFALHPQMAPLSATGAPTALTLFLLVAAAWGYWGHLEQDQGAISFRLLTGGIAWGLSILSGGWMALAFFTVLVLLSMASRTTPLGMTPSVGEKSSYLGIMILGITGAALALWWPAMMFQSRSFTFLDAWMGLTSELSPSDSGVLHRDRWASWLGEPSMLLGWWCVGGWSTVRIGLYGSEGRYRRWCRWLILWNAVGLCGRVLWRALEGTPEALREWDVFLCLPATLLAAHGLDRALRRETSRLGLAAAIAATVAAVAWRGTHHPSLGLVAGGGVFIVLLASAPLAVGLRRTRATWSEGELRAWVLIAAIVTLLGNAAYAIVPLKQHEFDHLQWKTIRRQMSQNEAITRTSIVANGRRDLVPWIYLVRSLWPRATFSQATGWDPKITATLVAEAQNPQSRIILFDWSRSGLRFLADVGSGWQVDPVVQPMAYRGRRLAVYLIHPTESPPPL